MGTTTIRHRWQVLIPAADDVALSLAETPVWDETLAEHADQLTAAGITTWVGSVD